MPDRDLRAGPAAMHSAKQPAQLWKSWASQSLDNVLHTRRMFDIKRCIPYSAFAHLLVGLAHGNNFRSNCLKVSIGLCHVSLLFIDYSSLSVSDRFIRVAEYHVYGRTRMPYAGHMS